MIKEYLLSVVAAALAVSLVSSIPQRKSIGRILTLLGGVIVLIAVTKPLITLRIGDLDSILARYRPDEAGGAAAITQAENESAALITQRTREYILDKAAAVGAELEVEVALASLSEHYRYPWQVTLRGSWRQEQKASLSTYISDTLGIPEERQIWIRSEADSRTGS